MSFKEGTNINKLERFVIKGIFLIENQRNKKTFIFQIQSNN